MSCVAGSNQTPIGTASNFLQCKWVSCSKSYWQGCDLGWYKDMGAPCFPQPNPWLARCASMSWTALKKFVVLSAQELRIGTKPSFHCGRKAWQVLSVLRLRRLLCLFRLAPSCRLFRLARWCKKSVYMVACIYSEVCLHLSTIYRVYIYIYISCIYIYKCRCAMVNLDGNCLVIHAMMGILFLGGMKINPYGLMAIWKQDWLSWA